MDERLERAWAAGFFDGEGWAAAQTKAGRKTASPRAQVNQADPNGVPAVLERFRRAVGCGQIYGPKRTPGRIDLYSWVASSRPNVARTWDALSQFLGRVKTAQFGTALGLPLGSASEIDDSARLAWACGFWDGEGSIYLAPHRSHVGYWIGEAAVTQASAIGDSIELARFHEAVGCGRIYGPYEQKTANWPVYRWKAQRLGDLRAVVQLLVPQIGAVKRDQATAVIRVLDSQVPLPRGNPAWGHRKSHCVKGHEYATARIRTFRPRRGGTERRASKQCLRCLREYAQRKRLEMKLGGSSEPPSINERCLATC